MANFKTILTATFAALAVIVFSGLLNAQSDPSGNTGRNNSTSTSTLPADAPDTGNYNVLQDPSFGVSELDKYNAHYYKLLIDAFERAGEWRGEMPREFGYIKLSRRYGAAEQLLSVDRRNANNINDPLNVADGESLLGNQVTNSATPGTANSIVRTPPKYRRADGRYDNRYFTDLNYPEGGQNVENSDPNSPKFETPNQRVLGVKVTFFRRGYSRFAIYPAQDIWIDGIAKGMEVYVNGRSKPHTLFAMLKDIYGREIELKLGRLDYIGWRRMAVPIPPSVSQIDPNNTMRRGLSFVGFLVKADPVSATGDFYMYLDNLSILVDRYYEETQSETILNDMW